MDIEPRRGQLPREFTYFHAKSARFVKVLTKLFTASKAGPPKLALPQQWLEFQSYA
jgi:hypothetical protein